MKQKMKARLRLWRRYGIHRDNKLASIVLRDIGKRVVERGGNLTDDQAYELLTP